MSIQSSTTNLNSRFWKVIFLIAGLITAGGVLPSIINPQKGVLDFTGQVIDDYYTLFFFQSGWLAVFVYGIGYLIVATKPSQHIGIVMIGLLGKLIFAINIFSRFSSGKFADMALMAASFDMIFVVLFGMFIYLYWAKNRKSIQITNT